MPIIMKDVEADVATAGVEVKTDEEGKVNAPIPAIASIIELSVPPSTPCRLRFLFSDKLLLLFTPLSTPIKTSKSSSYGELAKSPEGAIEIVDEGAGALFFGIVTKGVTSLAAMFAITSRPPTLPSRRRSSPGSKSRQSENDSGSREALNKVNKTSL